MEINTRETAHRNIKKLLETPQAAAAFQLEERDEDQQVIEDILDMQEEFESSQNLEMWEC